jgi:hypothetical protein
MPAKDTFILYYRLCTLRKHKLSFHLMSQNSKLSSIVQSPALPLKFSVAATWLNYQAQRKKSGIQPWSPIYRASHHRYVHPTTKLLPFQPLKDPLTFPKLSSWSNSHFLIFFLLHKNKIVYSFPHSPLSLLSSELILLTRTKKILSSPPKLHPKAPRIPLASFRRFPNLHSFRPIRLFHRSP